MHSMKPGRGPSFLGGISSIIAAILGIFWMVIASNIGAPLPFILFGLLFVIMAIIQAIYNLYNASAKNRLSTFDIVANSEEPDPLNERQSKAVNFCGSCGAKNNNQNNFCENCGKQLVQPITARERTSAGFLPRLILYRPPRNFYVSSVNIK